MTKRTKRSDRSSLASLRWPAVLGTAALVFGVACGDDGGAAEDSDSSGGTSDTSDDGVESGDDALPDSDGGETSDGTSTGDTGSTGADDSSGSDGSSETTDTAGVDCENLPPGPFTATPVFPEEVFDGSEDLGFDGQGNVALRQAGDIVTVDAAGNIAVLAEDQEPTYGLRFLPDGDLLAAAYDEQTVLRITPAGEVSTFTSEVGGVNGVYPDGLGAVWLTNFQAVLRVPEAGGEAETVVPGASSANGVVFDPDRDLLFFTNYGNGEILRAPVDAEGTVGTPAVVTEAGNAPDGLALDACGNLYVVDQQGEMIYRVWLDATGAAIGEAEALLDAQTDQGIANAQFGRGEGWNVDSLYAVGEPGVLYEIPVGVPGPD